jgi:hypothetical protein
MIAHANNGATTNKNKMRDVAAKRSRRSLINSSAYAPPEQSGFAEQQQQKGGALVVLVEMATTFRFKAALLRNYRTHHQQLERSLSRARVFAFDCVLAGEKTNL